MAITRVTGGPRATWAAQAGRWARGAVARSREIPRSVRTGLSVGWAAARSRRSDAQNTLGIGLIAASAYWAGTGWGLAATGVALLTLDYLSETQQ